MSGLIISKLGNNVAKEGNTSWMLHPVLWTHYVKLNNPYIRMQIWFLRMHNV
jgi:hypothetical protein